MSSKQRSEKIIEHPNQTFMFLEEKDVCANNLCFEKIHLYAQDLYESLKKEEVEALILELEALLRFGKR